MKNVIRILLLIVVLALLCVPFVDFGKPEGTIEAMQKKAEKEDYLAFTNGNRLTVVKNGSNNDVMNFVYFNSEAAVCVRPLFQSAC